MEKTIKSSAVLIRFASLLFVLVIIIAALFTGRQIGANRDSGISFYYEMVGGGINGWEVLSLLLLGFLSGVVGGMLSMGGGVLKVGCLHLIFGFDIIFARIVSLLSYFVIAFSAFWRYRKYRLILWVVVKLLVPSSVFGALIGIIIDTRISKGVLEIIVGIYALIAGIQVLNQIWSNPVEKEIYELPKNGINEGAVPWIGAEMGFISALTGISGGIISTPLQNSILKLPIKNCIANTLTAAVFSSMIAGSILLLRGLNSGDLVLGDVMFVTICLIPGNILGGQLGGILTKRLDVNYVRAAFGIASFIIGFRILLP